MSPYLVPVAGIVRDLPSSLEVSFSAPFDEGHEFPVRAVGESDIDPDALVSVTLKLESFSGGINARGVVSAPWQGLCRRCSVPVTGILEVPVFERFVADGDPADEEEYAYKDDTVDVAPLVHDAIFLNLPLAPLCREECAGLCSQCGTDRNEGTCTCEAPRDPRWAMLDSLRVSDETD
jgi:uncharacterized protein